MHLCKVTRLKREKHADRSLLYKKAMYQEIGLVSGITTLVAFALKSSTKLRTEIQSFRSQPQRVREILTRLLGLHFAQQNPSETGDLSLSGDLSTLKLTLEQCREACDDVKTELLPYCSRLGVDHTSFCDWLKLKYGGSDSIIGFRQQLIRYNLIIAIALSITNL